MPFAVISSLAKLVVCVIPCQWTETAAEHTAAVFCVFCRWIYWGSGPQHVASGRVAALPKQIKTPQNRRLNAPQVRTIPCLLTRPWKFGCVPTFFRLYIGTWYVPSGTLASIRRGFIISMYSAFFKLLLNWFAMNRLYVTVQQPTMFTP